MGLMLTEKDLENEEVLAKKLITLSEIVVRKHFYASANDKEDLVSIGVLKALKMIRSNNFENSKGNFATFLYTGMRNDMHNYLYHKNKFNLVGLSMLIDEGKEDNYFNTEYSYIRYEIVHSVCMCFTRNFGDNIESEVLDKLESVGFIIIYPDDIMKRYRNEVKVSSSDILLDRYGKETKEDIIDRIIGIILWKLNEKD